MQSSVNVIHVLGSLNVGGAESRIMDIYEKIDSNKIKFEFVSMDMSHNQFFEDNILLKGGKVHKIDSPRKVGLFYHFKQLVEIFNKKNKDGNLIVHAHTLHHCGIVMLAAKISNVKIRITQSRNTKSQHNNLKNKILIILGKFLIYFFATDKLAITEASAKFLYYNTDIKNKKVKIVPNAINLDKYKNISVENIIKLKKEYNINSNQKVIGHVGRFEQMKNHKFLIKLFFEYRSQNPNSILILIGDGSLKKETKDLVDDLKLTDNVLFLGIRNDVHFWMNIFDVVLLPSLFEGLPGVVSEEQAAGTPCILSNNITRKSDLNLGLLTYVKLNDTKQAWINAIKDKMNFKTLSFNLIEEKFDKNNLSLNKGIEALNKIYNIS